MATVRAVIAHQIPDRPPLRVRPGQRVQVGKRDPSWPAFVFVTAEHGSGWMPARYLDAESGTAVVLTHYDTAELATVAGDVLTVLHADDPGGWVWVRNAAGAEGWVPSNTVESPAEE